MPSDDLQVLWGALYIRQPTNFNGAAGHGAREPDDHAGVCCDPGTTAGPQYCRSTCGASGRAVLGELRAVQCESYGTPHSLHRGIFVQGLVDQRIEHPCSMHHSLARPLGLHSVRGMIRCKVANQRKAAALRTQSVWSTATAHQSSCTMLNQYTMPWALFTGAAHICHM